MKKLFICVLAVSFFGMAEAQVKTPQPSLFTEVEQMVGLTEIEIEYSRPNKNGREIFGNLVPFDKIWRTGANKNSTIEFKDDVTIEGQNVKKGKYAIFTKPGADSWEIYFYSDNENWGNPAKWEESKIVAKVNSKVNILPFTVESFTISLDDLTYNSAQLRISWDNVMVETKIITPTDAKVQKSIDETLGGTPKSGDYIAAANFYFSSGKDIQKAKEWMDQGMKMNEKPAFYQIYQQALIHQKAGDKKSALNLANQALESSKAAGSDDYVKLCTDLIQLLK